MDAGSLLTQAPIKTVFFAHFVLVVWATLAEWLPISYVFYNAFFFLTLLWSLHNRDSYEPVIMAAGINMLSVILDAVCIGVYYNRKEGVVPGFGFSAFMAIINLLLRPLTCLLLLKVFNERCGRYSTFGLPGLGSLGTNNIPSQPVGSRGSYENLDAAMPRQSVPSPIHEVEGNIPNYGDNTKPY